MNNSNSTVQTVLEEMSKKDPAYAIAFEEVTMHPFVEAAVRDFELDLEEYDEY